MCMAKGIHADVIISKDKSPRLVLLFVISGLKKKLYDS